MLPLFDRIQRLPIFLEDALDRGAVVLTANQRSARALETAYAEDQRSRGVPAWPQPRILDWNSWVASLWEQYARRLDTASLPLSALQEQQIWERVQGADRDRVVAPDRMAELAQEAYGLLGSYCAHPLRRAIGLFVETHEDAERFLVWADAFDRLCEQNAWIARSRLEETLAGSVQLLEPVPELYLVGFDRTTPAQLLLLEKLQQAGAVVSRSARVMEQARPELIAARDQREELEACAWWCRRLLSEDASQRIAIIVPDLGRVRADIDRIFRRILMPQATLWPGPHTRSSPDAPLPYEFSLGANLGTLPLIHGALLLLQWLCEPIASDELTWLLTTGPLAASAADNLALARLDQELRREGSSPKISLDWLLSRPRRSLPADLRTRLLRLQALALRERLHAGGGLQIAARAPSRGAYPGRWATHAHWAELVPVILKEAGWPGFREIDSFTFQAQQRWVRLLGEIAELGFDGSQPTWSEFLGTLRTHAGSVIFAAESTTPPIQILGAFESSGQSFDALWFAGADDGHWPAVGRLHPLLPAWLQRDAGMPHASPEADWLLAKDATARIVASAPRVVLSYAATDQSAQAVAMRASPLVLTWAGEAQAASVPAAPALRAALLEKVQDDSGTIPWPEERPAGGAEVLKRQAACAFQSFAMRRLETRPLDTVGLGMDAAERGTALHAVLEQLWSAEEGDPLRLHTRDDLHRAKSAGSLEAMLAHQIREVFTALVQAQNRPHDRNPEPAEPEAPDPWTAAYLSCEQQRVHDRLLTWLDCELERQPFSVEAIEKRVAEMQIGALRLRVRLDRVDRLADGSHLLIDYKTGKVQTSAWMGERPEEPQLPLYALFSGIPDVSGIAFAQIRADQTQLMARAANMATTVCAEAGSAAEKSRFDEEVLDGWREALLHLAGQFLRGQAMVNPRDQAKTCRYCPLAGLCRVYGSGALEPSDAGDDSGGGNENHG